jgi:Flp pilus assembly protein TadD
LILLRQGDLEAADRHFRQAADIDPMDWRSHYYLGLTLIKRERYAGAHQELNTSLSLAPGEKRIRCLIYLAIGECWEKQGNLGQAKLSYITALNLNPDSTPAADGLARVEKLRQTPQP